MKHFGKLVLTLSDGQIHDYELIKPTIALGKSASSDIKLADDTVSGSHARIECSESQCSINDLDSLNGTFVNGLRIQRWTLNHGDEIRLGDMLLRFEKAIAITVDEKTLAMPQPTVPDLAALAEAHITTTLSDTSEDRLAVVTPDSTREVSLADLDRLSIGRASDSGLVLDFPGVSRHHAIIERVGSEFVIRDQGSTNGTWLDNRRIKEHTLTDGNTFRIEKTYMVFKRGFEAEELFVPDEFADFVSPGPKKTTGRRPIVVIPAMGGSELWRGGERIWPDVLKVFNDPNIMRMPDKEPLEPRAILEDLCIVRNFIKLEQYRRLREFLEQSLGYERGKDFLEFPYDWRQDVRISARRLAMALDNWPVFCKPPVTIIAHSLGCLVARYYVEKLGGKDKVNRLLLMGGPHHGVPTVVRLLHSASNIVPFNIGSDRLHESLVTFPAMYQVLPTYACGIDQHGKKINVLLDDRWMPEAQRPLLADAREFRRELGTRSSVPTVSIFGYGRKTVIGMRVNRNEDGTWREVDFTEQIAGDHTTPEYSAVLDPAHIHPVQQYHGSLYVDQDVQKRLKLELRLSALTR